MLMYTVDYRDPVLVAGLLTFQGSLIEHEHAISNDVMQPLTSI